MRMITKEQLEALRSRFPAGTRVELLQMDDVQAPPIGTKGTVTGVDDTGSLMVNWDNGSGLNGRKGKGADPRHTGYRPNKYVRCEHGAAAGL